MSSVFTSNLISLVLLAALICSIFRTNKDRIDKTIVSSVLLSFASINLSLVYVSLGGGELSVRLFYITSIAFFSSVTALFIGQRAPLVARILHISGALIALELALGSSIVAGATTLANGYATRDPGAFYPVYIVWVVAAVCSQLRYGVAAWRDTTIPALCNRFRAVLIALVPTYAMVIALAVAMLQPEPPFNAATVMPLPTSLFCIALVLASTARRLPLISFFNDSLAESERVVRKKLLQTKAIAHDLAIPTVVKVSAIESIWRGWALDSIAAVDNTTVRVPSISDLSMSAETIELAGTCFPEPLVIEYAFGRAIRYQTVKINS